MTKNLPAVRIDRFLLFLVVSLHWTTLPSQAGIFKPLLGLARPRIQSYIESECIDMSAGNVVQLREAMLEPCKAIAKPITECLIVQTESSGRKVQVIQELLAHQFGESSELVIKRCIASTLGLRVTALDSVPLRKIIDRMKPAVTDSTSK